MPEQHTIPPRTDWKRANPVSLLAASTQGVGVDREKGIIYGAILAQEGVFKDQRGEFDRKGLREIVRLAKQEPVGLKARFGHPTLSDDGVGKHLGRWEEVKLGSVVIEKKKGDLKELAAVRGNLRFDKSAYNTPSGDLATYVMSLVDSDAGAINNSMVLQVDERFRLKPDGTIDTDDDGNPLPPLWFPTELHACDVVDTGAATDSFLSVEALPDAAVREGAKLLDRFFAGQTRETVQTRCLAWLDRYLLQRFGPSLATENKSAGTPLLDAVRDRLEEIQLRHRKREKTA